MKVFNSARSGIDTSWPPARFHATDHQPFEHSSSASSQCTAHHPLTSLQQDVTGDSAKSLAKAKINNIHLLSPHQLSWSSKCRWLSRSQTGFPLHKSILDTSNHLPVHVGKWFSELACTITFTEIKGETVL